MRPRLLSTVVVLVLLVLASCGSGGTTSKATSSSTSSSTSVTSTPPVTGGATTPVSVAPTHPAAHLVAVRAARQADGDRVVFEFTEQVPGYRVAYSPKPIVGTSGKETPLGGSAALVVRMQQASGVDLNFRPTYKGPNRLAVAGTQHLQEVAQVEDFEGVLVWALGLKAEVPFRVLTLSSPPRLVVDLGGPTG